MRPAFGTVPGPADDCHVDRRALDHPLEGCRGHRFGTSTVGDQIIQVSCNEFDQRLAQFGLSDRSRLSSPARRRFVDQGSKDAPSVANFVLRASQAAKRRVDSCSGDERSTGAFDAVSEGVQNKTRQTKHGLHSIRLVDHGAASRNAIRCHIYT